jgi:hypothetical protein
VSEHTQTKPYQIMPPPTPEERAALKEAIRQDGGILVPVEKDEHGNVLDGHCRVELWEELRAEGVKLPDYPVIIRPGLSEQEKRAHVRSLNLARRHLTRQQRRELIAEQLRETPQQSNRQIAGALRCDHKTVGEVRGELQVTGEIPQLTHTEGKDGKRRPAVVAKNRREAERAVKALAAVPPQALPDKVIDVKRLECIGREQAREKARSLPLGPAALPAELRLGDFREALADLADGSVDLIFTDPDYTRANLPLYGDLAAFAARVLVPGGSLVCYAGGYAVPEILDYLRRHLRFHWPLAVEHTGAAPTHHDRKVHNCYKPLLWFTKGRYEGGFVRDLIRSEPTGKKHHAWEQSPVEAAYCIERLCPLGGLVVDPFCGSGTTLVAARQEGRRAVGCDVDPAAIATARARLQATPNAGNLAAAGEAV